MIFSPAHAQGKISTVLELGGNRLNLSSKEMEALGELGDAVRGSPRAIQDKALAAARRVAQGRDALYALALYQLELGRQRDDNRLRAEALDVLIPSNLTTPAKLVSYLGVRGEIAYRLGDFKTARTLWTRLLEMKPNDPEILANLAQAHQAENDAGGAAALLERAIAARQSSGQPASEIWYRQRMSVAHDAKLAGPGIAAAQALVSSYPSPSNWRDALLVYRQLVTPKDGLEIDLLRLMRATGSLARANEYQRMAQLVARAGPAAEAKAVLDEGLARGLLNAAESPTREIIAEIGRAVLQESSRLDDARQALAAASAPQAMSTADSLLGVGRHSEAIALYRSVLHKAGVNSAEVHTRLGRALYIAGRRAEAEAAFRLAAGDAAPAAQPAPYRDLAQFWLAWLAHQPGSASS